MRCVTGVTLLTLMVAVSLTRRAAGQEPVAGVQASIPAGASATLPDAPSSIPARAETDAIHLPSSFRPAWAVDRSRLGDKLRYGLSSLGSSRNFAEAFLLTGIPNLPTAPTQPNAPLSVNPDTANVYEDQMDAWGHSMDGWRRSSENIMRYRERRLETGFATAETRQLLSNLALPIALRQEARYRPAPIEATLEQRMVNAAASIVVTHDDHGRVVPNYSKLGGTVAAGFIGEKAYANLFQAPEFDSSRFLIKYVGYSLAADLATNAAHELLRAAAQPDIEVYNLHGRSTEDSYYPLSAGAKFIYWAKSTYAPRNFVEACLLAGLPSIGNQPLQPNPGKIITDEQALFYDQQYEEYGNAIQDWRRHLETTVRYHEHRLIGGFAASETQMVIQNLAIPMALGIDPRYIPLGRSYDAGTRLGHVFRGFIQARTDSGGKTINFPLLVGTAGGALLAKQVYYPMLGTPALETNRILLETIGGNLVFDLLGNLRSEFLRHKGY